MTTAHPDLAPLVSAFAPTGTLRASINLGNPVLARRDPETGHPYGISVDLAHGFAERLGAQIELVVFETAADSVEAVASERADIGFFAIDPKRGQSIAFTAPYVLIEGAYLVRDDSPIASNDEVDRAGQRVVVGGGSAYDLYLSRHIQSAEIVRAASSQAVVETFVSGGYEVGAGVRQQLEADIQDREGLRLLPGRFMVIRQAMGVPRSRGAAAIEALAGYVEEMKSSGYIEEALRRHGIQGASVAPAGDART